MKTSSFLSLKWKDALKGLITAVLTTIATSVYEIINNGALPTKAQWHVVIISGAGAGIAYVLKNLLTNSNDQFLKTENTSTIKTL